MARKVFTKILIDDVQQEWYKQDALGKKFGVSTSTIWRLLNKFEKQPKYKDSILYLSQNLKLVNYGDFLAFLKEINGEWAKE